MQKKDKFRENVQDFRAISSEKYRKNKSEFQDYVEDWCNNRVKIRLTQGNC